MPLDLTRLRKKKKLSQLQLSKRAGMSRSYISELESGKYDPSKTICRLCKVLECEPNELIIGWRIEK
ncbi:helix-turn-helix domain-containing protein [Clostridium sp. SYSU_GA19001]|uniref:helix-turn-helix domain-containing protein n=1 Tax=Clostridium caldaquaticum TaxID=2940653 RepID=UPI0020778B76|nr:helix-turn-helix transcriptional regulator [Clostridium caldaquaticum]MCM8710505.1 helix-turn-helix domain-containing protein [Clostridium caldaquaticum]